MSTRGAKRKRGPAKPHQSLQAKDYPKLQAQPSPEQILPGKLHHSVQEFKRLAKQARVNEAQAIIRKLKALRSSDGGEGKDRRDPAKAAEDLDAQLAALKTLNLAHFGAAALIQKLKHNRILSTNQNVSEFVSTVLQPSLPPDYYTIEPNGAEGKIRNRLTSCKSFSPRASELVMDLQAILDPSVAKTSSTTAHPTVTVDEEEEGFEDHVRGEDREGDFFDQAESSEDLVDDDGWESGSIHSGDEIISNGPRPPPAEFDLDSTSDTGSLDNSDSKPKSKVKLKVGSPSEDGDSTPDSDSDSDTPPLPLHPQKKAPKPSGAGTSTFLPSLSVGYIPGTGDSDPEDELEVVEGKNDRKNRRGQRARRAIWEKKYGKGAKHVVKQREEEAERKRTKEERRRKREAATKRPHWASKKTFEPPKQTDSGYGGRLTATPVSKADGQPPPKKLRREDKALHPSWEAKKKMKQKESAAIIPPAGKKIVF